MREKDTKHTETIRERGKIKLERIADVATRWIGSTSSIIFHTLLFIVCFLLPVLHIMAFDKMLLVLTTVVSLEAIYLAIFIQMSVNKNSQDIENIQEDVEEIQEDIEEIQEDVEEIQEDVEEIQEDVDEIQEDVDEIQEDVEEIQEDVEEIQEDVEDLQEEDESEEDEINSNQEKISERNAERENIKLEHIKELILQLQKEIAELKR